MSKQNQARYFLGENPLLKCKNCGENGHWARECPNETKRAACILCGKDTHDSFSCTEKICFKCNKVGHLAINCMETNVIKCNRCGLNGHKEMRCLKIWRGHEHNETQLKLLRCIECGKAGHLKCTKEKVSSSIPIDTIVKDDLNEFIKSFSIKENTATSYVKEASSDEEDNANAKERDLRFSFDYIEEIKALKEPEEQPKPGQKSNSWIKNNTNIKVPEKTTTYSSVHREA